MIFSKILRSGDSDYKRMSLKLYNWVHFLRTCDMQGVLPRPFSFFIFFLLLFSQLLYSSAFKHPKADNNKARLLYEQTAWREADWAVRGCLRVAFCVDDINAGRKSKKDKARGSHICSDAVVLCSK